MAKTLEEVLEENANLKVSIAKLETTNENLKAEKTAEKEKTKALTEKYEALEKEVEPLKAFKDEADTAKANEDRNKTMKDTFKMKDKFIDMAIKEADLGEDVKWNELTEEQKTKIEKVLEANPEFKASVEELANNSFTTEEVLNKNTNSNEAGKDISNISNS